MARAIPFFRGREGAWGEWSLYETLIASALEHADRRPKMCSRHLCDLHLTYCNGTREYIYMSEIIESFVARAARQPSDRRPDSAIHRGDIVGLIRSEDNT